MFRPGHYGVSLTLYAPAGGWLLANGHLAAALAGGAGLLWLAMLPDLDTRVPFVPHRGPTHTLPFAALVAGVAWAAATATGYGTLAAGPLDLRTFAAGIGGFAIISHLLADVLTPMGVALLWPLSDRRFTLGLCRASNRVANYLLFALGIFATGSAAYLGTVLFAGGPA